MSYELKIVDCENPETDYKLRNLIQAAFGTEETIPEGHLFKNTVTAKSSKKSFFLVAEENNEFIGCNGFIATDFKYNEKTYSCYQSCWTATHPKHQGKRIFVNIINEAIRFLKEQGAGFIYGVPNDTSRPIFVKKLGFKEIPAVMMKIPAFSVLKNMGLSSSFEKDLKFYYQNVYLPVETQICDLKMNIAPDETIAINVNNSFAWGKIIKKQKFGITFKSFYVGGMEIQEPKDFELVINRIIKDYSISYIQLVSCINNKYNNLSKGWKPAQINPFIFYDLNEIPVTDINIMYGAIDVF